MCIVEELKNGHNDELDTNLYSRQIYALGESAMKNLRKSSVLISGIGGVGVEIAKNLILGGVRHITIHDQNKTKWSDLSAQYYLREEDIGRNRAEASFERLSELNDSVTCRLNTDQLSENLVKQFDLTILTDSSLSAQLEISKWIRKHGKMLLIAETRGLFSYIFADLGQNFCVMDPNGEQPKEFYVGGIDSESGDVFTLEPHGLMDGDYVTFGEIKGMTQLNNCEPIKVTNKGQMTFNIGQAAQGFEPYLEGGRGKQVKQPTYLDFKTLEASLESPDFTIWDFAKFDYPAQLHALFQAIHRFEEKFGRSPRPRNDEDVSLLKDELPNGSQIDENLLKAFSYGAQGNLVAVCSVVGGIAAQEAMKAVTHHMTPLKQFLYIDHVDALPGSWSGFDSERLTIEDCSPRNNRYDGQAAVFGWPYQEELANRRLFIVGAGAIGCELLKNLAMMGVACDKKGLIKITDMDQIETSNLNRQFLFRKPDVGGKKSVVAAEAVKKFNPSLNIEALFEKVCAETTATFNDGFFEDLHLVLNALDNVEARRYMDQRCVFYGLPLLESGTLGTKGNTQVIYPHLTEEYSAKPDSAEKEIPYCTLKNFPTEIQHTIAWARDKFQTLFSESSELANRYVDDAEREKFLNDLKTKNDGQQSEILVSLLDTLERNRPQSSTDCIVWARKLFQDYYHDSILQMLHLLPPDMVTDKGAKFWAGSKRCPHPLIFDPKNPEHLNFVLSAQILRAVQFDLNPCLDKELVARVASSVQFDPFVPKKGVRIALTEGETNREQADSHDDPKLLLERLKEINLGNFRRNLNQIDFEKDDDTNFHVQFVTSCSNLRAENYDIEGADFFKTKGIAGKIIPAIATTTAAIAGLVCVEFMKTIDVNGALPKIPIEKFKNGFLNLAFPFTCFSEPSGPKRNKYGEKTWTVWDSLKIKAPMTVQEVVKWIQTEAGEDSKVLMITCGNSVVYSGAWSPTTRQERLGMELKDLFVQITGRGIPLHQKSLVLVALAEKASDDLDMNLDDGANDIEIPDIRYIL